MTDETNMDANPAATETKAAEPVGDKPKSRTRRKKAAPRLAKAASVSVSPATKVGTRSSQKPKVTDKAEPNSPLPAQRKRTKYTPAQRASILASIEQATKGGKTTLKAALQQADVSEQTYYNWKNAIAKKTSVPPAKSSDDDLSSLVALEAENLKLRKELAAKLRAENEELRRRLGLA